MIFTASLPVRERGLKLVDNGSYFTGLHVAPRAGAWIEIKRGGEPHGYIRRSLPVRERGLKFRENALFAIVISRSPCGSVD